MCFKTYVVSVSIVFGRMLQVFHLDVTKVDLVLDMLQWDQLATGACCSCWDAAVDHRAGA
jgi:hypothetical protein